MAFLVFRIVFERLTKKLLGRSQVALLGAKHGQTTASFYELRVKVERGLQPLLGGLGDRLPSTPAGPIRRGLASLRVDAERLRRASSAPFGSCMASSANARL